LRATERNSEQLKSLQSAESQWVRLDRSGWGPGGRRFKSCLPDHDLPANRIRRFGGSLSRGAFRGPILHPICTPPRVNFGSASPFRDLRPQGSEPGGRRLATTQALLTPRRARAGASASGAALHREQARAVQCECRLVRSEAGAIAAPEATGGPTRASAVAKARTGPGRSAASARGGANEDPAEAHGGRPWSDCHTPSSPRAISTPADRRASPSATRGHGLSSRRAIAQRPRTSRLSSPPLPRQAIVAATAIEPAAPTGDQFVVAVLTVESSRRPHPPAGRCRLRRRSRSRTG
jgi:hypothetical protein